MNRLLLWYRDGGGAALIHQARGRTSNNHLGSGVREYALELVRRNYRGFGPTLATEALEERHGTRVGRETVRKWMMADGLWLFAQAAPNLSMRYWLGRMDKVGSPLRTTPWPCSMPWRIPSKTSEKLAGKYVDPCDYTDGQLEVRRKSITLPYRVAAKDQRITQTAIVENKRLSHALSLVKAQQELKREAKVLTNSEKGGYKKCSRQVNGPNFIGKPPAPKSVEMTV